MNKQTEALKMAIEYIDKLKSTGQTNWLEINVIQNACKEALEHQEVGDAEIKQMLDDIDYYKNRLAKYEDVL